MVGDEEVERTLLTPTCSLAAESLPGRVNCANGIWDLE